MPRVPPAIFRTTATAFRVTRSARPFIAYSVPVAAAIFPFTSFSTSSPNMSAPKVQKSESEWRAQLSPEQFRVLRQQGTEAPGSSPLNKQYNNGVYHCVGCDAPLYVSKTKFDSGCGWPSFYDTVPGAVERRVDSSHGMERTEIVCTNCGGHLGHVFKENHGQPINERHCVNGISINFKEDEK